MSNAHVQRQYRSQRVLCVSEVGLYDGAGRSVHMWRAHVVSILNSSDINFRCCCWTGSFAALYQYNAGSLCKRTTVFQLACTQHVLRKSSRWPRMCHPVYFRAAVSTPDCCFQCRRPQTQRVQSDQETESRPRFSDGARGVSSAIKQSKRGGADSVNWDSVAAPTKTYFSELWKQRLDSFDQTELSCAEPGSWSPSVSCQTHTLVDWLALCLSPADQGGRFICPVRRSAFWLL